MLEHVPEQFKVVRHVRVKLSCATCEKVLEGATSESDIRGRPPNERWKVRQARAWPLLKSMHEWLERYLTKPSRRLDMTTAVRYTLVLWLALVRYIEDGRLEK